MSARKYYLHAMKKIFLLGVMSLLNFESIAQIAALSVDTVNLGVVFENQSDSTLVYLKNTSSGFSVFSIERTANFPFVGDTVVSASYQNKVVLSGDSLAIWVKAKPIHNVIHKGALVFDLGIEFGQVAIPYKFQGRYSKSYYNTTENLWQADLRTALKNKISSGTTSLSYNVARDNMYGNLDNVNGDVTCVYTGRVATFNTRSGATSNGFNTEHTWPQSLFSSNLPMQSDLFHLFSTDEVANSQRGNLPFGVVTNPQWQVGGSKKNATTFEPRDAHKGACARAMMYFVLRYQDYSNFFAPQQSILRQWHLQFLPNLAEQVRNDGIYALQNNRNPFIDYPQFAKRITSLVGNTQPTPNYGIFVFDTVQLGYQAISANNAQTTLYIYNYGTTITQLNNFIVNGTGLQFAQGSGTNVSVAPGHAVAVHVEYNLNQIHDGKFLSFSAPQMSSTPINVYFMSENAVFSIVENASFPKSIKLIDGEINWPSDYGKWQLTDAYGRIVAQGAAAQGHTDVKHLPDGVYFFSLYIQGRTFVEKISLVNP